MEKSIYDYMSNASRKNNLYFYENNKEEMKMKELKQKLNNEVLNELDELLTLEMASQQYIDSINGITKLTDRLIELEKLEIESVQANETQSLEAEFKQNEIQIERKDRFFKNILTGINVVGGMALMVWGALNTWEFEKEGTIGSKFGTMFMNSFRIK